MSPLPSLGGARDSSSEADGRTTRVSRIVPMNRKPSRDRPKLRAKRLGGDRAQIVPVHQRRPTWFVERETSLANVDAAR